MLTLRHFSKSYNDTLLLEIGHLTFERGVYWLKGENGSGKTSLFKSIAGILPFKGDVFFSDGTDAIKNPVDFRKKINYSEAEPSYPGFLTSKDMVRFIGKIKNASLEQQNKYCKAFGVNVFFEKPIETYSSGMAKKLGLALAFLGQPKLIILDEPLITLDEATRKILFGLIKERLSQDVIFLMSSHQTITSNDLEVNKTFLIGDKTLTAL